MTPNDQHLHPYDAHRKRLREFHAAKIERLFGLESDHLGRSQAELQAQHAARLEAQMEERRAYLDSLRIPQPQPATVPGRARQRR